MANVKADRVKKQFEKPPKQKREETVKYPKYAKPETLRGTQIRPQDELQRHGREKAVNPESFRGKKAQRGQPQPKMNCRKRSQGSQRRNNICPYLCVLCVPSRQRILLELHDSSLW
jgi:hypothetical protein